MKPRACLIFSLLTTGVLVGATTDSAQAQLSGTNVDEFRQIEQSSALNLVVTTAGLGLLGLELWWFMFSKPKTKAELTVLAAPQSTAPSSEKTTALITGGLPVSSRLSLRAIYEGIEMAQGVLTVEARLHPRFSEHSRRPQAGLLYAVC